MDSGKLRRDCGLFAYFFLDKIQNAGTQTMEISKNVQYANPHIEDTNKLHRKLAEIVQLLTKGNRSIDSLKNNIETSQGIR